VRDLANHEFARLNIRTLHLHMTLEAKIVVAFGQKLPVDRAMGVVAGDAPIAQRFVLKDERSALLAMTLRAALIQSCHRQAAGGLHDVMTMRVVALDAVHDSFHDGMMLWKFEFGMDVQMTLETCGRIFTRINDESPPTAHADMLACCSMARFATGHGSELDVILRKTPVCARRE